MVSRLTLQSWVQILAGPLACYVRKNMVRAGHLGDLGPNSSSAADLLCDLGHVTIFMYLYLYIVIACQGPCFLVPLGMCLLLGGPHSGGDRQVRKGTEK